MRASSLSFAAALFCLSGCALNVPRGELPIDSAATAESHTTEKPADGTETPPPDAARAALARSIADLQSLGPLDPAISGQLADDLAHSEPHLWPLVLAQLQSKVAYQRTSSPARPEVEKIGGEPTASEKPQCEIAPAPSQPTSKVGGEPTAAHVCRDGCCAHQAATGTPTKTTVDVREAADTSKTTAANPVAGGCKQKTAPVTEKNQPQPSTPPPALLEIATAAATPVAKKVERKNLPLKLAAARSPAAGPEGSTGGQVSLQAQDEVSIGGQATSGTRASIQVTTSGTRTATVRAPELAMRNLSFCSDVSSYGVYSPLDARKFRAGQEALIYAEIENFRSEPGAGGFRTALKCRYRLLNAQGACCLDRELPAAVDVCRNRRRDFFLRYFVWLPANLPAGLYKIEFSAADGLDGRQAKATADFAIVTD